MSGEFTEYANGERNTPWGKSIFVTATLFFSTAVVLASSPSAAASRCRIDGAIAATTSRTLSGAVVTLVDRSSGKSVERTETANGHFRFENVPPGNYLLKVRKGSQLKVRELTCTNPGEAVKAEIRF